MEVARNSGLVTELRVCLLLKDTLVCVCIAFAMRYLEASQIGYPKEGLK